MTRAARNATLLAMAIVPVVTTYAFVDAWPQPAAYFDFADRREVFGVPNFWNVASNLLFFVFGISGLRALWHNQLNILPALRHAYLILFAGIVLTAFGSGWFHLRPDNDSLFWDRLPMTVAFMPLFAVIVGEHVSASLGQRLLLPLLIAGLLSVLYWDHTENLGAGDLRAYGLVQFLPMLLIPAILLMYRSAFDRIGFLWGAMALYAAAKGFEFLDVPILAAGNILSGHSLKHVTASFVPLVLIRGMLNRQRTA